MAMDKKLRTEIRVYLKKWFPEKIKEALTSGHELGSFNVNPLVLTALASGVFGELSAINMAKALLYPRVFGTSISTTFGDRMQKMCTEYLGAEASGISGMDLEFDDKTEKQRVVMQLM